MYKPHTSNRDRRTKTGCFDSSKESTKCKNELKVFIKKIENLFSKMENLFYWPIINKNKISETLSLWHCPKTFQFTKLFVLVFACVTITPGENKHKFHCRM